MMVGADFWRMNTESSGKEQAVQRHEKITLLGSEDAPSGRNCGSVQRLHGKGGIGTAGELFKNYREGSGIRGFAFYEENTGLNSEDVFEECGRKYLKQTILVIITSA